MSRISVILLMSSLILAGACGGDDEPPEATDTRPQFVVEDGFEMDVDRGKQQTDLTFEIQVTNHGAEAGAPTVFCTVVYGDDHVDLDIDETPTIAQHETETVIGRAVVEEEISNKELESLQPECDA